MKLINKVSASSCSDCVKPFMICHIYSLKYQHSFEVPMKPPMVLYLFFVKAQGDKGS